MHPSIQIYETNRLQLQQRILGTDGEWLSLQMQFFRLQEVGQSNERENAGYSRSVFFV